MITTGCQVEVVHLDNVVNQLFVGWQGRTTEHVGFATVPSRPMWRIEFDNGQVCWLPEYELKRIED